MEKIGNRKSEIGSLRAFTLIELLVVIAIIGVLAAFIIPTLKAVKRNQYLSNAKAELGLMESAIEAYKSTYGFYPPGNPRSAIFNPLYYELLGTTNENNTVYSTLDGSASIKDADLLPSPGPLGVGGFINCSKPGASEDAQAAKNFLPGLKANQYGLNMTNTPTYPGIQLALLLCSVGGPDQTYQPLGSPGVNPWRYSYPGTNNPGGYDLYVQLVISGKTNLVCNWSKQVQINSPLP